MIAREVTVQISLSPRELAVEWCNMNSKDQADFFKWIDTIVTTTWKKSLCFQLQNVHDDIEASGDVKAKMVMDCIGQYSGIPR